MTTKTLLFFISFSISLSALCSPKKEARRELLYERIGVSKFVENLNELKSYKSYEHIDKTQYHLQGFYRNLKSWYYFDVNNYQIGLNDKLNRAFSTKELSSLINTFQNPFMVKLTSSLTLKRDIFTFHQNLLDESYKPITLVESRQKVLKSLFNLVGFGIQKDDVLKRLTYLAESKTLIIKMLKNEQATQVFINPSMIDSRLKNIEKFIIVSMARDLQAYRHYELREYIRLIKSPLTQKFLQVFVNYHYLYISKYIQKVEFDKINQLELIDLK